MKQRQPLSPDAATMRLESLCARGEQCTYDLRQKLYRWGIAGQTASAIIDDLVDRRYVDDARFARAYVADKYRFNRWGRAKIRMGLMAKRLTSDVIDEALDEIDEPTYRANLLALLRSRVRQMGEEADTYEGRTKLLRFGASRGYEPRLVIDMIQRRLPWASESD